MHIAALENSKDVLEYLVSKGADVNAKTNEGQTPLHKAAWDNSKEVLEYLVSQGADINAKDVDGYTPLHCAARQNSKDVLEYLVSKGAEVNAKTNLDLTPLHIAALENSKDVLEYLVSKGADVNTKNNSGQTPLHTAVLELLNNASEPIMMSEHLTQKVKILENLVDLGADVNAKDDSGETPLHKLTAKMLQLLPRKTETEEIDSNATKDDSYISEMIRMHQATEMRIASEHRFVLERVMKYLVSKGADIDLKDNDGRTPLDYADTADEKHDLHEILKKTDSGGFRPQL